MCDHPGEVRDLFWEMIESLGRIQLTSLPPFPFSFPLRRVVFSFSQQPGHLFRLCAIALCSPHVPFLNLFSYFCTETHRSRAAPSRIRRSPRLSHRRLLRLSSARTGGAPKLLIRDEESYLSSTFLAPGAKSGSFGEEYRRRHLKAAVDTVGCSKMGSKLRTLDVGNVHLRWIPPERRESLRGWAGDAGVRSSEFAFLVSSLISFLLSLDLDRH